ncbi:MAG: hypothetical protein LN590_07170 [Rickettsia endosymbiont of Glossina mortisans submortisans]|nr:hypothetical protein [Rickettsia endosymbiont of Glossina mortisans submortisans]
MTYNLKSSININDIASSINNFHIISDKPVITSNMKVDAPAHKGVDLAYKIGTQKYQGVEANLYNKHLGNSGWDVLATTADDENTNQYGYKAVAFINRTTKEIHISTAGTIPKEKYDLIDDGLITFGYTPNKPVKEFVTKVLEQAGGKAEVIDYTFSTSGHSLGAILSDLTAVEIHSRGLKFEKSVTFDNPGSKKVVENAITNKFFTGEVTTPIQELAKHCEIYNVKHNFINTTNPHLATDIKLVVPTSSNNTTIKQPAKSSGV